MQRQRNSHLYTGRTPRRMCSVRYQALRWMAYKQVSPLRLLSGHHSPASAGPCCRWVEWAFCCLYYYEQFCGSLDMRPVGFQSLMFWALVSCVQILKKKKKNQGTPCRVWTLCPSEKVLVLNFLFAVGHANQGCGLQRDCVPVSLTLIWCGLSFVYPMWRCHSPAFRCCFSKRKLLLL